MKVIVIKEEKTIPVKGLGQNIENVLGGQRATLDILIEDSVSYENIYSLFSSPENFEKILYFSNEEKGENDSPYTFLNYTIPLGIITTAEGMTLKLAQKTAFEELEQKVIQLEQRIEFLEKEREV